MLVNTCSYNGGACLIYMYISVRVQKSKRKGAFQTKLALDTVHFHALQRCARINEAV